MTYFGGNRQKESLEEMKELHYSMSNIFFTDESDEKKFWNEK